MRRQAIIATTHIDAQNERFTRQALEGAADLINSGDKPLVTLDHDTTIPPHGKILSARVEKRDDGEYQLITEQEIFQGAQWLTLSNGTKLFIEESSEDHTPFADKYQSCQSPEYEVLVDLANFSSRESEQSFFDEIEGETQVEFVHGEFGRKAAVPDPEIIIKLANTLVAYLVARDVIKKVTDKVLDKAGETLGDDVAVFYKFVKTTLARYSRYVQPRNRPITYVFLVPRQPRIEFVARSSNPDLVLSAIKVENLQNAISEAEQLHKTIGATRIQFLLSEGGKWEFNYLLTETGGVVGTEKSFSSRSRKMELMLEEGKPKRRKR